MIYLAYIGGAVVIVFGGFISFLLLLVKALEWRNSVPSTDHTITEVPITPSEPPKTVPTSPVLPPVVETLVFDTPKQAYHSTRVICDEIGLTLEQKNTLCACVYQESGFLTNPKPNQNIDKKTGKVWSTDYGIVQINDYWHIGKGKSFPSVQYVLDNPEKCIRWMAGIYKNTGNLNPWSSYASGAYKKHLSPGSKMWTLST